MAITITDTVKEYRDLDLNFTIHPIKKDINKHTAEMAVINSVKNLVLTQHYEIPFQPEIGSNIQKLLFEPLDSVTASLLDREIRQVIKNFEPRASVDILKVIPNYDKNGFTISLQFYIINRTEPISIQFLLERVR